MQGTAFFAALGGITHLADGTEAAREHREVTWRVAMRHQGRQHAMPTKFARKVDAERAIETLKSEGIVDYASMVAYYKKHGGRGVQLLMCRDLAW